MPTLAIFFTQDMPYVLCHTLSIELIFSVFRVGFSSAVLWIPNTCAKIAEELCCNISHCVIFAIVTLPSSSPPFLVALLLD